jgi:hypothetical protein
MWTSTALASEHRQYEGVVWRVVEAQHRISTNRLATDSNTQAVLEQLADEVKPTLPESARHLDFLLAAPFRYGHKQASRFRQAHERPGIFYSAETEATAIAEAAYWRLRFYSRSPGFAPPASTIEHTSYYVKVACDRALDLTTEPFAAQEANWTDPVDYSACQELASAGREARTDLIRTISVRDPERGCNVVILEPSAFAERSPHIKQTWHFRYQDDRLMALSAFPSREHFEFTSAGFGL